MAPVWLVHAVVSAALSPGVVEREVPRTVLLHNQWDHCVPYAQALAWQRALHSERIERLRSSSRSGGDPAADSLPDAALLMQHEPVYTLGTRSDLANIRTDVSNLPGELHRTGKSHTSLIQVSYKSHTSRTPVFATWHAALPPTPPHTSATCLFLVQNGGARSPITVPAS